MSIFASIMSKLSTDPLKRLNQLRVAAIHKRMDDKKGDDQNKRAAKGAESLPLIAALEKDLGLAPGATAIAGTAMDVLADKSQSKNATLAEENQRLRLKLNGFDAADLTLKPRTLFQAHQRIEMLEKKLVGQPSAQAAQPVTPPVAAVAITPAAKAVAQIAKPAPVAATPPVLPVPESRHVAALAAAIAERDAFKIEGRLDPMRAAACERKIAALQKAVNFVPDLASKLTPLEERAKGVDDAFAVRISAIIRDRDRAESMGFLSAEMSAKFTRDLALQQSAQAKHREQNQAQIAEQKKAQARQDRHLNRIGPCFDFILPIIRKPMQDEYEELGGLTPENMWRFNWYRTKYCEDHSMTPEAAFGYLNPVMPITVHRPEEPAWSVLGGV